MTISSLTSASQSTALSLISGTTYESTTSVNDVLAQGQGTDEATISKGAQQMSKLSQLATSDPEKFKEAAQKISDQLTEKAKSSTDSHEASMLTDMASKFADAAKTGNMDSLKPQSPPSGASGNSSQNAAFKFKSSGGTNPMATVDSVVSGVLSDIGATSSTASSSTVSSVSASSDTAA